MDPGAPGSVAPAPASRPIVHLLYAVFFFSGAAGLMYESVWTRYLGLFVGHDATAQVLVLVIFLGGMSLGAAMVARVANRIANPLLWYAGMDGPAGSPLLGPTKRAIAALMTSAR